MPKLGLIKARQFVVVTVLVSLSLGVGYVLGALGFQASLSQFPKVTIVRQTPPEKNVDFALFWQVWDKVSATYYDKSKVIPSQMVYGAIKGMVASIGDPYTAFFTPAENRMLVEDLKGDFEGVGIEIGYRNDKIVVIAPLSGTPAESAGLKSGDEIVAIKSSKGSDDRSTAGMALTDAVSLIRGPRGTKVTLTLRREGVEEEFMTEVVRGAIHVASVTMETVNDGKVALVKISKFGDETLAEWSKVAQQLKSGTFDGVILDVRNNPGGYFQAAIDIASEFLPAGKTVVIEEKANGGDNPRQTSRDGSLIDIPVVVYINRGSASASEILAAALNDNGRATLVGEASFGKGTVQQPENLDSGAGIHITVSRWLTPNGTWVNDKGVEVAVKVDGDESEFTKAALDILSK